MDQNGNGFLYKKQKFLRVSEAKIKERIFVSLQNRQIVKDSKFDETFSEVGVVAWRAYKAETTNFVGNVKAENYASLVEELLSA
jgi:hypothetical protein